MRIEGNWWGKRSVKLTEGSQLYEYITSLKNRILSTELTLSNDRPPHVEICSNRDYYLGCNPDASFKELLEKNVDTNNIDNYQIIGRAYVLNIGVIGEHPRHITIVFGVKQNDLEKLNKIVMSQIKD